MRTERTALAHGKALERVFDAAGALVRLSIVDADAAPQLQKRARPFTPGVLARAGEQPDADPLRVNGLESAAPAWPSARTPAAAFKRFQPHVLAVLTTETDPLRTCGLAG